MTGTAIARDPEERRSLIEQYMGVARVIALRYTSGALSFLRDDYIAEAYLALIVAVDKTDLSKVTHPKTYLGNFISWHLGTDIRKHMVRTRRVTHLEDATGYIDPTASVEEWMLRRERLALVEGALKKLTPGPRAIIEQDLVGKEKTAKDSPTTRVRRTRGLCHLRELIA